MKFAIQLASYFLARSMTVIDQKPMHWEDYKDKFNKTYTTIEEDTLRLNNFKKRQDFIFEHNAKFNDDKATYIMALNEFSDLSDEEFSKFYMGFKYNKNATGSIAKFSDDMSVPVSINWVQKGAVTPVKNQRRCGACYAFSATGAIEGQHFRKTGKLVSLSEQNIIDCSRKYGNQGCEGGSMNSAFEYVIKNNGIDGETSYPYEAAEKSCRYNKATIGATFTSFEDVPSGDEIALQKAVGTIGPVSVGVIAKHFMSYKSGIFSDPMCSQGSIDHAMLVVGYGIDNTTAQPYWLVKNSWGEHWGENGYIRIARNANNMCGIATIASFPRV